MNIKSVAEVLGVLAVAIVAASVAHKVGARDQEALGAALVAAVIYGWGLVKIQERALARRMSLNGGPAHARYGLVKAK